MSDECPHSAGFIHSFCHVSVIVRTVKVPPSPSSERQPHTCGHARLNPVLRVCCQAGQRCCFFHLSLSGVSVSGPSGGIPSFLILLVLELTAWRSTPLDLSTVIILTSAPQHLYPSTPLTSSSLPPSLCPSISFTDPLTNCFLHVALYHIPFHK